MKKNRKKDYRFVLNANTTNSMFVESVVVFLNLKHNGQIQSALLESGAKFRELQFLV